MHFPIILALVAPALAWTIPEGQPDGVYHVATIDGKEVHTLLSNKTNPVRRSAEPGNVPFGPVGCGGTLLNAADTDNANIALDAQCGAEANVDSESDFYSIAGCTVAYACNFNDGPVLCSAADRQRASADVTGGCGAYYSGWVGSTDTTPSYGYEYVCGGSGSEFCGRGVSG